MQLGIQNPVGHEQRSLHAADLAQGGGQFILPWIGAEFAQDLARRSASGGDGRGDAQDIGLVALNYSVIDGSADYGPQVGWGRRWIEHVEPLGRQIANTRRESVAENGACGKDMIGKAAVTANCSRIWRPESFMSRPSRIWSFDRRRSNHLGREWRVMVRGMATGFQAGGIAVFRVD